MSAIDDRPTAAAELIPVIISIPVTGCPSAQQAVTTEAREGAEAFAARRHPTWADRAAPRLATKTRRTP